MSLMELKNISKRFGGVQALSNVNFSVEKGEICGLVGENGAGKSTLMQIISGRYESGSYDGKIFVNGEEKIFKTTNDSEKAGIAMIYQELNAHLDMNVTENVFMGDWEVSKGSKINWKSMHQKAEELLARLGMNINPREKMRNLSNAEQQMVAICHALRKNPRILIMDEPTSTLPQKEVEVLFAVIRKLKADGITVILITHKMNEVFELCDRITVLRNGETVGSKDIHEIELDQVIAMMIGRQLDAMYPKEVVPIGEEVMRVENLTIRHPFNQAKNIVENISFNLKKGEILGLEGLVGSGRTEVLNAIYGQGDIVSGKIFVNGKEVVHKSSRDALKNGIALVTEDRRDDGFVGILSIKKNITLSSLQKMSKHCCIVGAREKEVSNHFMDLLRIKAPSIDTKVENLSGGNQQKVVLSKCLLTDPQIIFMDEPTRGIDIGAKSEIYKHIVDLAKQGKSVIMTSSERTELLNMTDRMVVLSGGKIQGTLVRDAYDEKVIVDMAVRS